MRDSIVALAAAEARGPAQLAKESGASQRDVALAAMRTTRRNFMAPDESEAFAAAAAVLYELYPGDERLRQEVTAIGDRNKMMQALVNGVPVDFDRVELTQVPDDALGLIELWRESARDSDVV